MRPLGSMGPARSMGILGNYVYIIINWVYVKRGNLFRVIDAVGVLIPMTINNITPCIPEGHFGPKFMILHFLIDRVVQMEVWCPGVVLASRRIRLSGTAFWRAFARLVCVHWIAWVWACDFIIIAHIDKCFIWLNFVWSLIFRFVISWSWSLSIFMMLLTLSKLTMVDYGRIHWHNQFLVVAQFSVIYPRSPMVNPMFGQGGLHHLLIAHVGCPAASCHVRRSTWSTHKFVLTVESLVRSLNLAGRWLLSRDNWAFHGPTGCEQTFTFDFHYVWLRAWVFVMLLNLFCHICLPAIQMRILHLNIAQPDLLLLKDWSRLWTQSLASSHLEPASTAHACADELAVFSALHLIDHLALVSMCRSSSILDA